MIWFRRYGWFHVPVSVSGAVVLFIAVLFCFNVFIAEDRISHSASNTLYAVYPYFVTTLLLYEWIADRTSRKRHPHFRNKDHTAEGNEGKETGTEP